MTRVLRQTSALFVDAYRELNSRTLFWITLALSVIAAGAIAAFGINEKGITFLHWQMESSLFTTNLISTEVFYKFIVSTFGISVWLTWAATILALISTSSIIPDFLAGGAVELTLSKPIGRVRLFLTTYVTGLLFVALQVLVFSGACFLVVGVRGHSWEPRLFFAVPIVLLVFSYLFACCALFGVLTRSAIGSLLLTVLCWVVFFGVDQTDTLFLMQRETASLNAESLTAKADRAEKQADRARDLGDDTPTTDRSAILAGLRKDRDEAVERADWWRRATRYTVAAKSFLPKTRETTDLLSRWLFSPEDMKRLNRMSDRENGSGEGLFRMDDPAVARRTQEVLRTRSTAWIIGTSLAFEGVVLALACWIFARRDF